MHGIDWLITSLIPDCKHKLLLLDTLNYLLINYKSFQFNDSPPFPTYQEPSNNEENAHDDDCHYHVGGIVTVSCVNWQFWMIRSFRRMLDAESQFYSKQIFIIII